MAKKCATPVVRLQHVRCAPGMKLASPADVASYLRQEYGKAGQEWFLALALSNDMRVLAVLEVSSGGLDQAAVDPKVLFAGVLTAGATGMVVAHNHPSGNATPSNADDQLTRQLVEGANLLALRIHDHLIITDDSVYSMMANGRMPR